MTRLPMTVALLLLPFAAAQAQQAQEESAHPTIGYPSVAAALAAVKANPNIKITTQGGWMVGDDERAGVIWSFAPFGYPAYPSVVKRVIVDKPDGIYIAMDVACEATKAACDKLVEDYKALNATIRSRVLKGQ